MSPRIWKYPVTAMVVISIACNANESAPTADIIGGQTHSSAGDLGRPGGQGGRMTTTAAGGNPNGAGNSGRAGQGGLAAPTATGGSFTGAGGIGGVDSTHTAARPGGSSYGGETGKGSGPHVDASTTHEGGSGGDADVGGTKGSGKDAATDESHVVGNPRRVLLCDEGNRRVLMVDLQGTGNAVWSTEVNDPDKHGDSLRDLQLVGGDHVAVSTAKGYVELDIRTGEIKKEVTKFGGVESLRRLPDGHTVLGGNSEGGVTLQELDGQDAPVAGHKVTFTNYGQLRLFRRTPQGTFLMGVGDKLVEVTWDKRTVWEMTIPDGDWVFQGLRLPDGTFAVTSGYGATIVVVDPTTKKVLRTLGGKEQTDAATVVPNFYAGFEVLPNGHFVVTNWEGHGRGHGGTGIQLLEYDPSGLLVWRWKQSANLVSSLHGAIVLDGLDTTKLHDDIEGVLAPATQ